MTSMTNYLIEPLAPLVFRSGKPFGSQASAADVIFPLPSAAAGLIRATSINQKQVNIDEHTVGDVANQSYQQVLSIKSTGLIWQDLMNHYSTLRYWYPNLLMLCILRQRKTVIKRVTRLQKCNWFS